MHITDTSNQDTRILNKPKKWLLRGLFLSLLVICLVVPFKVFISPLLHSESSFDRDRLRFSKVERGLLEKGFSVEGKLIASSFPTLFSPASGRIQLFVRPGDLVQKGMTLASLDSPELRSQLLQETALHDQITTDLERIHLEAQNRISISSQDIELKKLQNETSQRELRRAESLFREGLIHKMELDSARDRADISLLELNHASKAGELEKNMIRVDVMNMEKKLERQKYIVGEAQRKVDELFIKAPFDGIVGSLEVNRADALAPNQPILTLIDQAAFEIQIQIPENMGDDIKIGLPAEINYEGKIYSGSVASLSPEVTQSIFEGRVVFTEEHPLNMKQNQRISINIIQGRLDNVLKVKRGPFLESGHGSVVYAMEGQMAHQKKVKTGTISLTEVEILEGLDEGDTIIISDLSRFANAEKVFIRN